MMDAHVSLTVGEDLSVDNPHKSNTASGTRDRPVIGDRIIKVSLLTSLSIAVVGAAVGGALGSVGYLGVVLILETAFVPPLKSPENYGQFGFQLMYLGFFGVLYGVSFGVIPYTRFLLWLPLFAVITLFAISGDIARYFDATEVTCTAMLVIGAFIVLMAALTSYIVEMRDNTKTQPAHRERELVG